ncbi:MAG: transporter [Balneolaceae bacterium]|nr:transporter [Balneolaceae bacterium]
MRTITILFSVFFVLLAYQLPAQTCSCAGAPLISSQSVSSTSQGNLLLGITYEYNDISNLYTGDNQLANRSVERSTQSTLLEINYGITDRLTVSGTATFVQKDRIGIGNQAANSELTTSGLGDGLVLLKYVLHQNTIREQYQLAVGAGAKIPFGVSSLTENGIALNMDMQPGTGAWDGVLWSYFSKTFAPASNINLFMFNTFRATGTNERFGNNDKYEFGNEWVVNVGVTDKLLPKLSYIGMVSYRSTSSDQRNGQALPNTGGKWINLEPGLRYQLTQGLSAKVSGKIPVYQYLNGTQPTTAYSASISLFYNFGKRIIF